MISTNKRRGYWSRLGKLARLGPLFAEQFRRPVLRNPGYCPTCARQVTFVARDSWLRDHYRCSHCGSIPRERALMLVIESHFPNWREMCIHESSPVDRGASQRLARGCRAYIASQFIPGERLGDEVGGVRVEDLEALTFADESIDLHVTQDVMEHVLHPGKVFSEIARTLKPGGAHVFTVPIVNRNGPSMPRVRLDNDGRIHHLAPPQYHGNPVDEKGSLVTTDWGFDICRSIYDACGLFTNIFVIDDLSKGIRAEYIEVFLTMKPSA